MSEEIEKRMGKVEHVQDRLMMENIELEDSHKNLDDRVKKLESNNNE